MRKNGLNSGFWSTATIKLGKLEEKKLTRHKLSNKQSFKLSTILDRKITRNPEKTFAEREDASHARKLFSNSQIRLRMSKSLHITPYSNPSLCLYSNNQHKPYQLKFDYKKLFIPVD